MKVYTKIRYNIDTWEVLEEDSYEYDGPIMRADCPSLHCEPHGCDNCTAKNTVPCANSTGWTNDPVVAGVNDIDADHLNEMRNALDAERARRGQGSCGIGWPNVTPGVEDIQAAFNTSLKNCNNGLTYYPADGDVLTVVSDTYSVGALILASHVNNMRSVINQNEPRCTCDSDCGSDDYCACFNDCGACNYP